MIKKASIFISREARAPSEPATSIVVETEARLITSTALLKAADAPPEQRIDILAEASAQVQVLVDQSGGQADVNINVYVKVLAQVTVQVQQNTVRFSSIPEYIQFLGQLASRCLCFLPRGDRESFDTLRVLWSGKQPPAIK